MYECKMVEPFIMQILKVILMQICLIWMQKLFVMLTLKDDAWMYEECNEQAT